MTTRPEIAKTKAERQRFEQAGAIHNRRLHRQILDAWARFSPKMTARLKRQGILNDYAYVCQARMWQENERLQQSGLPVTDAREQAERAHLLLEPEDEPRPATAEETELYQLMFGLQPKVIEDRSTG